MIRKKKNLISYPNQENFPKHHILVIKITLKYNFHLGNIS